MPGLRFSYFAGIGNRRTQHGTGRFALIRAAVQLRVDWEPDRVGRKETLGGDVELIDNSPRVAQASASVVF